MDGDQRRLLVGVVIGVLLLLSGVFPHPVFASPYETSEPAPYTHQAVTENDSQFEMFVDLYAFDPETATPIDELSPTGQLAAERTIESEPTDDWRRYELPVCRSSMLICDSVREPPADFHYGEGDPEEIFRLIEHDGERYLFQTGVQPDAGLTDGVSDAPLSTFIWLFGLLPFGAVVLTSQAISQKTGDRRVPQALTAMGAGLLVVGVAVPYLVVLSGLSYAELSMPLFVGVGGLTLVAIGALLWQTVKYNSSTDS